MYECTLSIEKMQLSAHFYKYSLSIGEGSVTAASAAIPPLASASTSASAAETTAVVAVAVALSSRDPARLSDNSRLMWSLLEDRYNAVEPPPVAGGLFALYSQGRLVEDEAANVLVGCTCEVYGVVLHPDTESGRACLG